jgi:hypothetical protein
MRKIDDPRTIHGIEGHHHQGDISPRLRRVRKGVLHKPSPVQRNRFCSIKGAREKRFLAISEELVSGFFSIGNAHRFFLNAKLAYAHKQL